MENACSVSGMTAETSFHSVYLLNKLSLNSLWWYKGFVSRKRFWKHLWSLKLHGFSNELTVCDFSSHLLKMAMEEDGENGKCIKHVQSLIFFIL